MHDFSITSGKLCFYVWKFKTLHHKPFQANAITVDPRDLKLKSAE